MMQDGLYRATTSYFVAGFVVEQGRITICAPILRKRLEHWKTLAVLVEPRDTRPDTRRHTPSAHSSARQRPSKELQKSEQPPTTKGET